MIRRRPAPDLPFQPGISRLLRQRARLLGRKRVALLTHPAAVDRAGRTTAGLLAATPGVRLAALFGPEHGYFGGAGAGEPVPSRMHPVWRIPVFSLYGPRRRPTPAMLRGVDVIVVDLQDIGVRCYTFVTTLRLVLEAAAECRIPVIVADRPVPLPRAVDGPLPEPRFAGFVAALNVPLVYGLTPGEAARWIRSDLRLPVDLHVAPLRGYRREGRRQPDWPPWVPPSPGILSWESAACYPATVFAEAFPAIDHGRRAGLPFQLLGAPWLAGRATAGKLNDLGLPGVRFHSHPYVADSPVFGRKLVDGLRLTVTDHDTFLPATTGVCLAAALQAQRGAWRFWRAGGARPEWFDRLYGTDAVRLALADGVAPLAIAARWRPALAAFAASRNRALLYSDGRSP